MSLKKQIDFLSETTYFTVSEIEFILEKIGITGQKNHQYISRKVFEKQLNFPKNVAEFISNWLFHSQRREEIHFTELLRILSSLSSRATVHEKSNACFQVFDLDCDGKISKEDIINATEKILCDSEIITMNEMNEIINNTFNQIDEDHDGYATPKDFEKAANENENMLGFITFDLFDIF